MLAGTTMGLTGRQIALMTGRRSHSGVLDVLHRLADQGLVDRVELNRAYLFSLNRDHLAAPAVEMLMGMREELFNRIRNQVEEWQIKPVHMSVFGSTARGDGDTQSDIDLFLVRSDAVLEDDDQWCEQVYALTRKIERLTGNRASIHERSETQIAHLVAAEPPILASLRADAVVLSGPDIKTILSAE